MDQPAKVYLKEPRPYIVGFALTYKQVYAAACAELTEEHIHRHYNGDPFLAFRAECFLKNKEYDVIAFPTPPSDSVGVRYLYIIEVIPSWTGANPRATLTRKAANRFYNEHGRQEVLRRLFTACLPWPPRDPEPWWLKNHMWDNVKIIQEQRAARLALNADNNTESDATPSNSPTTVDASATLGDQPTPQNDTSRDAPAIEAKLPSSSTDAKAHPNDTTSHPSNAKMAPAGNISAPQDQPSTRPRRACTMKAQVKRQASR